MSLDYPEHEEIHKKSKFLGWIWRIGDISYYLGLMGAVTWPLVMITMISQLLISRKAPIYWDRILLLSGLGIAFFVGIFFGAAQLKRLALRGGRKLK
jgi:hypothetical protein